MKKILTALLLPMLTLISCSSDDNNTEQKRSGRLILEARTLETRVNKPLYFLVKNQDGDYITTEATITNLTSDESVSKQGRFKPLKVGEYTFQAKASNGQALYHDSNTVTVKVTEPTEKTFYLNGTTYQVDKATLSIVRTQYIDESGKEVISDVIVSEPANTYHNEYILKLEASKPVSATMTVSFLVPNASVKSVDGKITDFGKRIYPHEIAETQLTSIVTYSDIENDMISIINSYPNTDLEFYFLTTPKEDVKEQVLNKSYFELKLKDKRIDYVGDVIFTEIIE
ncbi:hypothetical protein HX049_13385 [Myroides odoratimimus]|uniref:hypothetical protein n=1 Tax=Myroides odoratimimus TaxID=76832 RepID=UPI0025758DC5|nr:hypothetical protein [Myroides odoratimimus]MDM1398162.1 hypothetical protein [Myroides odoratimimus]